ncbi:hypothetical protein D3C85_1328140 [compost metagenome]
MQGVLVFLLQHPIAAEHFLFHLGKMPQWRGRALPGQDIQHIGTARRYRRQVIGLGGTLATFIFALGIGLNATDFTKNALGETKSLSFFPDSRTNSTHLNV